MYLFHNKYQWMEPRHIAQMEQNRNQLYRAFESAVRQKKMLSNANMITNLKHELTFNNI